MKRGNFDKVVSPGGDKASGLRSVDREYLRQSEGGYSYEVESSGGARLDFVGVKHLLPDAESKESRTLQYKVRDFLERPGARQKVIVLEGLNKYPTRQGASGEVVVDIEKYDAEGPRSLQEAMERRGENALIEREILASSQDIEVKNFEPDPHEEFEQLVEEFGDSATVLYWLAARQAVQWAREESVPRKLPWNKEKRAKRHELVTNEKLATYVERTSEALGHAASFAEVAWSFSMLEEKHAELFGGQLDWNDAKHFSRVTDPTRDMSIINQIANRSNALRDISIANGVKSEVEKGRDVMVVYGDAHAWAQEPLYRQMEP